MFVHYLCDTLSFSQVCYSAQNYYVYTCNDGRIKATAQQSPLLTLGSTMYKPFFGFNSHSDSEDNV